MEVHEPSRVLPVRGPYDVVVAGGGIAGVSAAVAAARGGASVCLMDKAFAFGGLATLANVAVYLPICDGYGRQVMGGIAEELLTLSVRDGFDLLPPEFADGGAKPEKITEVEERNRNVAHRNDPPSPQPDDKTARFRVTFNPMSFLLALDGWVTEHAVDVLFDARVCAVAQEDERLSAVVVEAKEGRFAVAGRYFIDATGDADLAVAAGEPVTVRDTNVVAGWFYNAYREGRPVLSYLSRPYDRYGRKPSAEEDTFSGCTSEELTRIILESRKMTRERLESEGKGTPFQLPSIPSLRMTRRIDGAHTLTEGDLEAWPQDTVAVFGSWREPGPVYPLALGALRARRHTNLMAVGRCLAADGLVWDLTRAIPVCALSGEIAGTCASMAARTDAPFSAVTAETVRAMLSEAGGIPAIPATGRQTDASSEGRR